MVENNCWNWKTKCPRNEAASSVIKNALPVLPLVATVDFVIDNSKIWTSSMK